MVMQMDAKENYDTYNLRELKNQVIDNNNYCHGFQSTQIINDNELQAIKRYPDRKVNGTMVNVAHESYYLNPKLAFNTFLKNFDSKVDSHAALDGNEWLSRAQKAAIYRATVDVVFDTDENQFRFAFLFDFQADKLHIVDQIRLSTWFMNFAFMNPKKTGKGNQALMMEMLDKFYWKKDLSSEQMLVGITPVNTQHLESTLHALAEGDLRTPWYEMLLYTLKRQQLALQSK